MSSTRLSSFFMSSIDGTEITAKPMQGKRRFFQSTFFACESATISVDVKESSPERAFASPYTEMMRVRKSIAKMPKPKPVTLCIVLPTVATRMTINIAGSRSMFTLSRPFRSSL